MRPARPGSLRLSAIWFVAMGAIFCQLLSAQSSAPLFPVTPVVGSFATSAVVADFNGDGKPDLAFVPQTDPTGTGGISVTLDFAGADPVTINTPVCTGSSAISGTAPIAAGDLNNDGNLDLVVACQGYLAVLLGKGDGSFESPVYYSAGSGPASFPTLVDLNGDGYLDVAAFTSLSTTPSVAVFLNEGSAAAGTLGTPKNYPASGSSLVSGDFNGDGKADLLVLGDTSATALFGNGDGTLQPGQTQALPVSTSGQTQLTTGDFNHDGVTDFAYSVTYANSCCFNPPSAVQVLLGSRSGSFAAGPSFTLPSTVQSPVLAAAPLTGSGNLDLVASAYGATTIYLGDGKGGFTQGNSYAATGLPTVADLNGDGKPDLLLLDTGATPVGGDPFHVLYGNGDGTFQGIFATPTNTNGNMVSLDLNGDGITDVVYQTGALDASGDTALVSALGRGDGTFGILSQSIPVSAPYVWMAAGDFNGDGKPDLVAISSDNQCSAPTTQLTVYPGAGNGTFGAGITASGLPGFLGTGAPAVADFNGDGKLDLVLPFVSGCFQGALAPSGGLMYLQGNGDGTFASPVVFSSGTYGSTLFAGDLRKNGKQDFILQNEEDFQTGLPTGATVYLSNGDGTFQQEPLNLSVTATGTIMALADLNGDGYPDLVTLSSNTVAVYAGNGDGTFQTTPFYSESQYTAVESVRAGDVNGDGYPDLLVLYTGGSNSAGAYAAVLAGDGSGNFTADTHRYYAGIPANGLGSSVYQFPSFAVAARLNNQAPKAGSDTALDILANTSFGPTTLLNQLNPAATAPSQFQSATTVAPASGDENAPVTLTAEVLGISPTGSVTFNSGTTTLGTAPVQNGAATLQISYASAGTYSFEAAYSGDENNTASVSANATITIVPPDFSLAANPQTLSLQPGQSGTVTLTLTPQGGYTGSVSLSCAGLPSEATCSFSPATLNATGSSAVSTQLTILTTAAVAENREEFPGLPAGGVALAALLGVATAPRAKRQWMARLRATGLMVLLAAIWMAAQGCGGGSTSKTTTTTTTSQQANPGTPAGTYSVTLTFADSGGGPQHTVPLSLTIQ